MLHDGTAGADPSHFLVAMPDPSGNGLLEEIITSDGQQLVINPAKQLQRCEYCRKKMKKPYKHRNGKCMETKKLPARPRCPYCHIVFVRSSSIPLHVQNSCRVYRELCATSQELPEPNDQTEDPQPEEVAQPPPVKVKNNSKTVDLKPILQKSKPKPSLICRYCYMSFGKRGNLIKHQRDKCRVLNELDVERLTSNLSALESSIAESAAADTTVQEPEPESEVPPQPQTQDDEEPEETTCVYCTQLVGKKTRFQHHNGRCVLGRANADHPCPYCDAAYTSRSNLLRHQREHCRKYQEEQNTDLTLTNAFEGLPVEGDTSQDETIFGVPNSSSSSSNPIKPEKKPKPQKEVVVKQRKKVKEAPVKSPRAPPEPANFVCSYCRKGFALRDTLIEHQRSCTVRKQHKQVKCQFCGMVISNRGNLRKHQKVYCKRAPNRENAPKVEQKEETKDEPVPEPKKPKVTKPLKKVKVKKEKPSNGSPPVEDPPKDPLAPVETVPTPDDEPAVRKKPGRPGRHNKIPCEHCDREFQNKRQLKNHMRGCLKARKMYKCKYCPAAFTHPSNMGRHIRLKRCRIAVNSGGRDSVSESLENGFQSDNSNLLSPTVNDPEAESTVPAEEDFELIQPESSQECILPERTESAPMLAENNNSQLTQVEGADKEEYEPVPEPVEEDKDRDQVVQEEELVPPEAIIFTEEVELREQPSVMEVAEQQPASTLDAEQKEQQ